MSHRSPHWVEKWCWFLAPLSLGWCAGCSRLGTAREPVVIVELEDRISRPPVGVSFDLEKLRQMLETALEESKRLALVKEKNPRAYQAEVVITLATEREPSQSEESGIYRAVQLELSLSRWLDNHEQEKISAQGSTFLVQDPERVSRQEGFDAVLEQAVQRAVGFIDLQIESRSLSTEKLKELLGSKRTEDRLYVLRALRDRRDVNIIPRVVEMLLDPDPDVAMEAVGVLVAQKDQRAALPLIRMAQGRDQIFLLHIITALAEIQGSVARGYLFTVATGHSSPQVRKRAKEALDRILRDQGQKTTEPVGRAVALPRKEPDGSNLTPRGGP